MGESVPATDYYARLGVDRDASPGEIRRAYEDRAAGVRDRVALLRTTMAASVLLDDRLRGAYDRSAGWFRKPRSVGAPDDEVNAGEIASALRRIGGTPDGLLGWAADGAGWRDGQKEAVEAVLSAPTRFVHVDAPTGAGKSLIGAAVLAAAVEAGTSGIVLTRTMALQAQYLREFPALGSLAGQANYRCALPDDPRLGAAPDTVSAQLSRLDAAGRLSVRTAPCHDRHAGAGPSRPWVCPMKHTAACSYWAERAASAAARASVLNYHVWARTGWDGILLPQRPALLVCDEAHEIEGFVIDALKTTIADADLGALSPAPDFSRCATLAQARGVAAAWCGEHADANARAAEDTAGNPSEMPLGSDPAAGGETTPAKMLEAALGRMRRLADADDGYVWDAARRTFGRAHATGNGAAEDLVWRRSRKVVLMSATLTRETIKWLGLRDSEVTTVPMRAAIPRDRRPVYVHRHGPRLNRSTVEREYPRVSAMIAELARARPSRGIVHANSYRNAELALRHLPADVRARCVAHGSSGALPGALREYLRTPGAILVSPSVMTGFDFPDDACRWQVVPKLPYPYLGDPFVAARKDADDGYMSAMAALTLAQAIGRGCRGADDWCETWVLDGTMMRARKWISAGLPGAVREAVVIVESTSARPLDFPNAA